MLTVHIPEVTHPLFPACQGHIKLGEFEGEGFLDVGIEQNHPLTCLPYRQTAVGSARTPVLQKTQGLQMSGFQDDNGTFEAGGDFTLQGSVKDLQERWS